MKSTFQFVNCGRYFMKLVVLLAISIPSNAQWQQTGSLGSAYGVTVQGSAVYASIHSGGLYCSTNNGETWTLADSGITDNSHWALTSINSTLFAGTQFSTAFRSTNDGNNWTNVGLSAARGFVLHRDTLFACQWYNPIVFRSEDNGTSWTATGSLLGAYGLWPMLSKGPNLFVGAQVGGVYRSTNNGTDWSAVDSGLTNTIAYSLAVMGNSLFVGTGGAGVFRSPNEGETWSPASAGIENQAVYALLAKDSLLIAGTASSGVFVSTDSGLTWNSANQGLGTLAVATLASDDLYLYAGTLGGGVYRRSLSDVTTGVELVSTEVPQAFRLEQNYPNPFNPSTQIAFALPVSGKVTIKVYDILGQEVRTLVNDYRDAGYKSVVWDGKNESGLFVSSGTYLYRMVAERFMKSGKMQLAK
jgi:hypothetical protein